MLRQHKPRARKTLLHGTTTTIVPAGQQNETILTPATIAGGFGKVMEYDVSGAVLAQPLALYQISGVKNCSGPCNVIFIATEEDMLYAFDADYTNTQYPTALWSVNLAQDAGGSYVNCTQQLISPCGVGVIYPEVGVTGTPVIDESAGVLYVVSLVEFPDLSEQNFIHAIDYRQGKELQAPYPIEDTYPGAAQNQLPNQCGTGVPGGTNTFTASNHYQRPGLLFLNGEVFVGFNPVGEGELANGWLMAFTFNTTTSTFSLDKTFVTTPYGTGGGIWMDGAGLASDGTYIYLSTANGTFDVAGVQHPSTDYGDTLLQIDPSVLTQFRVNQYFTPADVFSFENNSGRCGEDEDLGSGGVMLFPDSFLVGHPHLLITADKESKFYVVDRDNLTGYNASGDTIIQELTTPLPVQTNQGYWGSPAYWEWSSTGATPRAVYYSVDATVDEPKNQTNTPLPMNMYVLDPGVTPGPVVPSTPNYSTDTRFCGHGGAPTVSSDGTTANTGIVWAYEDTNQDNPPRAQNPDCKGNFGPAALHAYGALTLNDLYSSAGLTSVNAPTNFSTPMTFHGKVYIGVKNSKAPGNGPYGQGQVDVFGLCNQGVGYPSCFEN